MRASSLRQRRHEEEEETVFVSMTDLTVGFLFIVILLLAFFASQYNPSEMVPRPKHERIVNELQEEIARLKADIEKLRQPNPLEAYINNSMEARRRILQQLKELIEKDFPGLELQLSEESLRFRGEGLFKSGDFALLPKGRQLIQAVADRMQQILPCYTLGADAGFTAECNAGFALIEAVQIEGHTDSDDDDMKNLDLSTKRATTTFRIMTEQQKNLVSYLNFQMQPVLSVAGYGEMRPSVPNDSDANKASNRRIDLRIIMHVPRDTQEIERVRDALLGDQMSRP